jgi:hypothetical protein
MSDNTTTESPSDATSIAPTIEELTFPHPYDWDLSRISVAIETVNAQQARSWLHSGNVRNRHRSEKHIARLLGIVQRGRWRFNGLPIVFDWNDKLMEGQHRLAAIQQAGIAMELLIVRGVDPDAFSTYDLCKRRTLRDAIDAGLEIADDESSATIATTVGYATAYTETLKFIVGLCAEDERVAYLDDNDGIRDIAKLYKGRNLLRVPGGLLAACHYLFALKSADEANEFMRGVVRGEVLDSEDPAWRFREYVDKMRIRRTIKTINNAGLVLVDAWNRFRRHEIMTEKLRVPLTSPEIE